MVVPKGVSDDKLAVLLDLMAFLLKPEQQAFSYDEGYLYPGPAVKNVPLSMAPKESQDIIREFGRPEYARPHRRQPDRAAADARQDGGRLPALGRGGRLEEGLRQRKSIGGGQLRIAAERRCSPARNAAFSPPGCLSAATEARQKWSRAHFALPRGWLFGHLPGTWKFACAARGFQVCYFESETPFLCQRFSRTATFGFPRARWSTRPAMAFRPRRRASRS